MKLLSQYWTYYLIFALVHCLDDIDYFNKITYKHILYGKCSSVGKLLTDSETQIWGILNGQLMVR